MEKKVFKVICPFIFGLLGLAIGYFVGSIRTSNRYLEKQREVELSKKELEYAKTDSLYLITHPIWKKQELKSQVYSTMFGDIQSANMDKLKKHSAINNPYWQEINILFNKLSPYCTERIKFILKKNSEEDKVQLSYLYNDLQQIRREIILDIGGRQCANRHNCK